MAGSTVIPTLAGRGRSWARSCRTCRRCCVRRRWPCRSTTWLYWSRTLCARVGVGSGGDDGSTKIDTRVGERAEANNLDLAYVPTNARFLSQIKRHFTALRYFALNSTDHRSHEEQNSMIRSYIAWRNRHDDDEAICTVSKRAKVA
jgi:hypothetical protein